MKKKIITQVINPNGEFEINHETETNYYWRDEEMQDCDCGIIARALHILYPFESGYKLVLVVKDENDNVVKTYLDTM